MNAVGTVGAVIVDCDDPEALAGFWGALLDTEVARRLGDPPQYVDLGPVGGAPYLGFQRVSERKVVKNRVHVDVNVEDVDAATARVEELGGRRVPGGDVEEHGFRWRVMLDPEGNEFCLIYG